MFGEVAKGESRPCEIGNELPDDARSQMKAALEGRAAFYDLLASIYFRPLTIEQIEAIAEMDMGAYADVNELFAEGLNDISRHLRKRNTGTRQELAVDFTSAFAGASSWKDRYAVPYESVFTSEEGLMYQESYHEVYRLYRENRVTRSEGYDFPDDHLSFMCEFMAVLSKRAIGALEAAEDGEALEVLRLSRTFLDDHILSWYDEFSELAACLLETRFYRGILKVSKGFFVFDAELLDELSAELSPAGR